MQNNENAHVLKKIILKLYDCEIDQSEKLAVLIVTIGMSARVRLTLITLRAFDC